MKISIDTKEDSEVEIRKAIRLLISLVGSRDIYSDNSFFGKDSSFASDTSSSDSSKSRNIFDSESSAQNLMNIFDSPSSESGKEVSKEEFNSDLDGSCDSDNLPQIDFY
jgi:hypothetical protein